MTYLEVLAQRIGMELESSSGTESQSELLFLLYALLARVKGNATTREDVHDAWVAWMVLRQEHHPSMVPFHELPVDVQQEDEPYVRAIKRVSEHPR